MSFFLLLPFLWHSSQAIQANTNQVKVWSGGFSLQSLRLKPVLQTEDELTRHIAAAENYQRSGDLESAATHNRTITAIALGRLGNIAIREGLFQRAVQLLNASLAVNDSSTTRTSLAIAKMRLLEIDQAITEAQAALRLDDKNPRAHHIMGKLFYMKGEHEKARAELERALVIEPDLDAAYTLGMAYLHLKQKDRAKIVFEEMAKALNNRATAHILFGRAYHETGFLQDAEGEFRKALAIDPKAARVHFYLGYMILLQAASERFPVARDEFEKELQANPKDFYSTYFLGILASLDNNHRKALSYLSEAIKLKPDSPDAFLLLGQTQMELSDADAEKSLRRAIELTKDPSHNNYQIKKAHFFLGRILIKLGRREEGEKELAVAKDLQGRSLQSSRDDISQILGQSVLTANDVASANQTKTSSNPNDDSALIEQSSLSSDDAAKYQKIKNQLGDILAQAYHNLGVIAAQKGQFAASMDQFAFAAEWKPEMAGLDRNWGIVSFRAGLYDKAIPPLSRQLKSNTEDALARRMLGVSYYLTKDFQKAVETLKPLETSMTDDVELSYAYGVSLVHVEDGKAATDLFVRLAQQNPNVVQARFYAAQGFVMLGDYERALKEFRTITEMDRKMFKIHYGAGQALIRLNRLDEAESEFRQELLLNPSDEVSKYHLAYVLLERKQKTTEAVALLREAIAARFDYADARYQMGKALIEQGNMNEAIEHLEIAARVEPQKEYIHYQLSIAYRRASRAADADKSLKIYQELKAANRNRNTSENKKAKTDAP